MGRGSRVLFAWCAPVSGIPNGGAQREVLERLTPLLFRHLWVGPWGDGFGCGLRPQLCSLEQDAALLGFSLAWHGLLQEDGKASAVRLGTCCKPRRRVCATVLYAKQEGLCRGDLVNVFHFVVHTVFFPALVCLTRSVPVASRFDSQYRSLLG
jgi:hypothetical protein